MLAQHGQASNIARVAYVPETGGAVAAAGNQCLTVMAESNSEHRLLLSR
jgi:hypothetical protein